MKTHFILHLKDTSFFYGGRTKRNTDFMFVTKQINAYIYHSKLEAEKEKEYVRELSGYQLVAIQKIHS